MEPSEVREKVARALSMRLKINHDQALVVGNATLAAVQECGLITVSSADLARVNHMVAQGLLENAKLRESLEWIADAADLDAAKLIAQTALEVPDADDA